MVYIFERGTIQGLLAKLNIALWLTIQAKFFLKFMDSKELAHYIEATDGISKPWLLVQLRLSKLKERKDKIPSEEYITELEDIQADLLKLGEWWKGIEGEVFGSPS